MKLGTVALIAGLLFAFTATAGCLGAFSPAPSNKVLVFDLNDANGGIDLNDINTWGLINAPAGTDPLPDDYNDTLNLVSGDASISITGNAATDTVDIRAIGFGGVADGNLYSLLFLSDGNFLLYDLNGGANDFFNFVDGNMDGNLSVRFDVNSLQLCLSDDCINSWGDVNFGGVDTNDQTAGYRNALGQFLVDQNFGGNEAMNISRVGIGTDNPVFNVEINSGAGLADWIRVISNNGTRTFASEMDGLSLDMMFTSSTNVPWRFIIGGVPSLDLVPVSSEVNVHVYDELRWYDDEDRDGNYAGFRAYSDLNESFTWTLPTGDGNNGQAWCTDGALQLGWCDINAGGVGGGFDGNVYSLGLLRLDNNVWQIDLNTIGDVNGFRLCINGNCIDSWADVNTYQDTTDGNVYSLGLLSDLNIWQIDLNTIGDVNGFRLCINGVCIDSWADVNTYFDFNQSLGDLNNVNQSVDAAAGGAIIYYSTPANEWDDLAPGAAGQILSTQGVGNPPQWIDNTVDTNIADTNAWESGGGNVLRDDDNSVLINWVPYVDADFGIAPDRGLLLGLDTNRWLRYNGISWYTGLLNEDDTQTSMFSGTRRCQNCAFEPPPDFNYTHRLAKSGFAPIITVPEWQMHIPVSLSGGAGVLVQNYTSFLQDQNTKLSGGQTMANIDSTAHYWQTQRVEYSGQTSNTIRSYLHHYGARMDNYNGVTPIALVPPGIGCDVIQVVFDEPLPNTNYNVQLTGYNMDVEGGEPEPWLYSLHTGATIDILSKTINGFTGEVNYTLYDHIAGGGRIAFNPVTGQDAEWCNFTMMTIDMGMVAVPERFDIDWMIRMYD